MARKTSRRLLALAVVTASAACSDAKQDPMGVQPTSPNPIIEPIDGEPTYYSYDATISGSGGLPDWENAAESHSRSFREIYQWSDRTGSWDVENDFPSAEQEFNGYVQSTNVDVAQSVKRYNSYTATNRSGYALSAGSSRPPINLVQQGSGPAANRTAPTSPRLNRFTATQASPRADAPRFTPAEIRASRADRVVVTPQGKARELALLRRQFGEGSSIAGSLLEFTKKQGDEELRIHFDPAVGAVTRMVLYNNQKKRTEIVRRYRREGDMWLIAAIETKTFDESGRISSHSVEDIRSIEMR